MLDSIDLEKILLKLCGNHLELKWVRTVYVLEYFVYKSSKSEQVIRIKNNQRGKC